MDRSGQSCDPIQRSQHIRIPASICSDFPGEISSFIKRADLSRDRDEQRPERFSVGQKVDARITQFDKKSRRIAVSIKALEIAEEKEAVAQYGSTDSGASLGDILGAALKNREDDED